jgi:hypothetical protein
MKVGMAMARRPAAYLNILNYYPSSRVDGETSREIEPSPISLLAVVRHVARKLSILPNNGRLP